MARGGGELFQLKISTERFSREIFESFHMKIPTLEDFQRQFKDLITPGMAIYDFHAHTDPNDVNGVKLGEMVIPNRCVDKSKFADERLWFQHHRIEEDIALKPEWKDKYEEVC